MKTVQFLQQYYCKLFLCCMQDLIGCMGKKNYDTIFGVSYKNIGSVGVQNANFAIFRGILTVMIEKRKQGKAGKRMGISHEYHSTHGRRRRSKAGTGLRLAGVIVAILLVAYAVTAILEKGTVEEDSTPQTGAGGIAQNILAPLPMQGEAASGSGSEGAADSSGTAQAVQLESFGPARQTDGAYTIKAYDASVIRQPACGQVDLSYFSDAAFLGDSLTVGFSDYQINLSGALICGYTGVGPDAIVNRAAVKSPTRGQEVALDVLAAAQPKKLYILLGTNTLTTLGASDRFLAYYGRCWTSCARRWERTALFMCSPSRRYGLRQRKRSRGLPRTCCAA